MSARVAIVAGAGGPLGRATSMALVTAGFTVVAVDRNGAALHKLPDSILSEAADTTPQCRSGSSTGSPVKSDYLRYSSTPSAPSSWEMRSLRRPRHSAA